MPVASDWWRQAFACPPTPSEACGHPCGADEMLAIIAYDIADPRRWARIAKHCEDYGVRVQYSVFECRMPMDLFEQFWQELTDLIEPNEDRLVAYRVCSRCAKEVRVAGTMETTANTSGFVAYIF